MSQTHKDDDLIAPRVFSRYRQMGIIPGWPTSRLTELCHLANRTPEEIGAFAGLAAHETRRYMARGSFPPPVSLHFAAIEASIKEAHYGDPVEPVIPLDLLERKKSGITLEMETA